VNARLSVYYRGVRVLVCGGRNFGHLADCRGGDCLSCDPVDFKIIEAELAKLGSGDIVIEGDARGADRIGGHIAAALGHEVLVFPAQWDKFHRAAGLIRNQQMLTEGKPDRVLAFHRDLARSKGTKDMVARSKWAGLPVEVLP